MEASFSTASEVLIMQVAYCDGVIIEVGGPAAPFRCANAADNLIAGKWIFYNSSVPFDASMIDPVIVAQLFGAGFLLFLTPWAAAYGFKSMLKMLR